MPFSRHKISFPRAIVHIDGDSFFASCEQSRDLSLQGRPVVTGKERGIVSSMSREAKLLGITRAMPIFEIKKKFPQVIIIPSDYETYALLSARFMDIVRRYTPEVEEYGIDECFADITGLRKLYRTSYYEICRKIQNDLERELNCTFSIGLASSKTLAKIGSNWRKSNKSSYKKENPRAKLSGLTAISNKDIKEYLYNLPVGDVWNIGPQTSAYLRKNGITTAYQFICKEEKWITSHVNKNFFGTWKELRGEESVQLKTDKSANTHSIQRTRTFTPPSNDPEFLLAKLIENIDTACMRARIYRTEAREVSFFLKSQSFHYTSMRIRLSRPTAFSHEIVELITPLFKELYKRGTLYRATGFTMYKLRVIRETQMDLFGGHLHIEKMGKVYKSVDKVGKKYGRQAIHVGTSFLNTRRESDEDSSLKKEKFLVNARKQKLGYPLLFDNTTAL